MELSNGIPRDFMIWRFSTSPLEFRLNSISDEPDIEYSIKLVG